MHSNFIITFIIKFIIITIINTVADLKATKLYKIPLIHY